MSDEPHRSRTAWPGPMSTAGLEPGHEHDLPAALIQRVRLQGRAVVILGVCIVAIGTLLMLLISERSQQRDQENDRTNQRINDAICDLLDQLPEGGLLERPRAKYGCGPGIPIDQLPQEIQDQLADRTPRIRRPDPEPADAPAPVPSSDIRSGVQSSPSPITSPPSPTVPPLVDLGPVTDPCETTGVCG